MAATYSPTIVVAPPNPGSAFQCAVYHGENPDSTSYGIIEQVTSEGMSTTVHFICPWENRYDLILALKGNVTTPNGGVTVNRDNPTLNLDNGYGIGFRNVNKYTKFNRQVFAGTGQFQRVKTRISQGGDNDGELANAGWPYSDLVIIPANFETTTYQTDDRLPDGDLSGRWYTTTVFKPAGEIIHPPTGVYTFTNNGGGPPELVQDQQIGIYRSRGELTITRHFMPYSGSEQMQYIVNCVNEFPVKLADGTKFASETLLMTNIESRPWAHPATGITVWDITYYMLVNTAGPDTTGNGQIPTWNQIMNRKGVYANIADERGNPPFAKVDFITEIWPDAENA